MSLLILSFIAGVLSILAPCVLPVLPVILGGSLGSNNRRKPLTITLSTGLFITVFTIALKASTALIDIPQSVWTSISAVIIILYGLTLAFPHVRETISQKLGLYKANQLADSAKSKGGIRGDILLGASLGPIFASCSPTYALLLSTVFPQSFTQGVIYTIIYSLGFALGLLAIAYGGRSLIKRLSGFANPNSWFKKILGGLLILTGLLIISGWMKKLEVAILDAGVFNITGLEQSILERNLPNSQPNNNTVYPQNNNEVLPGEGGVGRALLNANYLAPDIIGVENWINTSGWNSLSELRGKVVIIDFWTYSCINCIRTLPYIQKLHEMYADDGLVIIGVHAPEFQFERDINNVRKAALEYGLTYPIVQDNNFATWKNYNNRYRPAKYIIDKEGKVRYTHFGEGAYEETEQVVQYLLGVDKELSLQDQNNGGSYDQTPETYLGNARRANFITTTSTTRNERRLDGSRLANDEKVVSSSNGGSITINAYARQVNLVLGSSTPITADIMIDGVKTKSITIDGYNLYNLYQSDNYADHQVSIIFDKSGIEAYAYTFG